MTVRDEIERTFEGRAVLDKLLAEAGSLADSEDVAAAFAQAVKDEVPAPVVIEALWDDEPKFSSPEAAAQLFGNLLGLYELIASGQSVDLQRPSERQKREKATRPEPFGDQGPDDAFVEATWRYFDDFPKERQRFEHAFENRQDELVSWLDASGLSDSAFGLARQLIGEVFAMLELGGHNVPSIDVSQFPSEGSLESVPAALREWIEESLYEASTDETAPLTENEVTQVRRAVTLAVHAMAKP